MFCGDSGVLSAHFREAVGPGFVLVVLREGDRLQCAH